MRAKNGILKGELKVKKGKLLKCMLTLENKKIREIKFTGDFFMYPEEKIEELENTLRGRDIHEETLHHAVDTFFLEDITTFGASKEDFFNVVMLAIKTIKTTS